MTVVACYLGSPIPLKDLQDETRAGELGICSMADLARVLKRHGFAAEAVRYESGKPSVHDHPMILFVNGSHFLTVLPKSDREIVVIDPPAEPRISSWTALEGHWRGEALVVARGETEPLLH